MSVAAREIAELQKTVRYLLTRQQPTSHYQFTEQQRSEILRSLEFIHELKNQGGSTSDFLEQLKYLQDITSFQSILDDIFSPQDELGLGTHYNIYTFTHGSRTTFYSNKSDTDRYGTFEDPEPELFKEGYLVFELRPNHMIARGDNLILKTENQQVQVGIEYQQEQYVVKTNMGVEYIINVDFDQLVNGNQTRYVGNTDFIPIKYVVDGDQVNVNGVYLKIDLSGKNVTQHDGSITTIPLVNFDILRNNLPFNITDISIGFNSKSGNEHGTLTDLFTYSKISTFNQNLERTFLNTISDNPINSIYGQSTAVSISQLFNQLTSTVMQLKAEYTLKQSKKQYLIPSTETLPGHSSSIPSNYYNKLDLFGSSYAALFAYKDNVVGYDHYYPAKPRQMDNIPVTNYYEIAGSIPLDFKLSDWRLGVDKTIIQQVLENGQLTEQESWIEFQQTAIQYQDIKPGNWIIDEDTGSAYVAKVDGLVVGVRNQYSIRGARVTVADDFNLGVKNVYPLVMGFRCSYRITGNVVMILAPNNLAADGVPDTAIGSVTYEKDGITTTKNVTFSKMQIAYGGTTRMVYRGVLESIIITNEYVYGHTGNVRFRKADAASSMGYNSRDNENVPVNFGVINAYKNGGVRWSNSPTTLLPGTLSSTGLTYAEHSATALPSKGIATCVTPYNSMDFLLTGTAPFYSPNTVEYTIDFEPATYNTKFTTEGVVLMTSDPSYWTGDDVIRWSTTDVSFTPVADFLPGTIGPYVTSEGFLPSYQNLTYGNQELSEFWKYSTLTRTPPTWTDDVLGWRIFPIRSGTYYQITNFSMSVTDLILPNKLINQLNIAENIVALQTAVQLLEYYATYLNSLIENLDVRLTYVEDTLNNVIDILNAMFTKEKGPLGVAGSIISFIGTGIGMFFPLVGLGVSLIGGILSSVNTIQNGDIVVGSIDLIVGGLMAVMGGYKWSKRLKNKYGQNSYVYDSSQHDQKITPSIDPGFSIFIPGDGVNTNRRTYRNGVFVNTNYDYETFQNAQNEAIFLRSTETTRISKQSPLWATIDWDIDNRKTNYQSVFIVRNESEARSTITYERKVQQLHLDDSTNIIYQDLTQPEMSELFDVDASIHNLVQLDILYSQCYTPFNYMIGLDDEIKGVVDVASGYELPNTDQDSTILLSQRSSILPNVKALLRSNSSKPSKWKLLRKRPKVMSPVSYPKMPINVLYDAFNPFNQHEQAQLEFFDALLDVLSDTF